MNFPKQKKYLIFYNKSNSKSKSKSKAKSKGKQKGPDASDASDASDVESGEGEEAKARKVPETKAKKLSAKEPNECERRVGRGRKPAGVSRRAVGREGGESECEAEQPVRESGDLRVGAKAGKRRQFLSSGDASGGSGAEAGAGDADVEAENSEVERALAALSSSDAPADSDGDLKEKKPKKAAQKVKAHKKAKPAGNALDAQPRKL